MRGKTVSPPQGAQASEGQVRQVSKLFGEAVGDTQEWIEIHRTSDEWELKLIQATLSAQKIRCRPLQLKPERQTALLVAPEHELTALELVSRIGVAVTDNEMTMRSEAAAALKQRDIAVVQNTADPARAAADSGELLIAEHEAVGCVVYLGGRGYEIRVGPEPYTLIAEADWEEFTDFSAQRQEFVILLRHEYPDLFEWIQEEKRLAEFTRLIEMTYQDGAPSVPRPASRAEVDTDATPYHPLAQLSLTLAVISLIAVLFQIPWAVNLGLGVVAVAAAVVAKYRIDASEGASTGVPMALSAIVLACLVVVFAWWLDQRPAPVDPTPPPVHERLEDR